MTPALHSVFWSFLRIGAGAFGGGLAALPVFEAEIAARRHWSTPGEVAEAYAISQSVPGVIIVNFAVLTGLRLRGARGALCAATAVVLPAFFIILALAAIFRESWDRNWVAAALAGLRPAVIALVAGAAFRLGRGVFRAPLPALAAATCAGLMLAKILGPAPLLLLGAAMGVLIHGFRARRDEQP